MKKIIIRIPEEEHRKFKLFCLLVEKSINCVGRSLIQRFLNEKEKEINPFKIQKEMEKNGFDSEENQQKR